MSEEQAIGQEPTPEAGQEPAEEDRQAVFDAEYVKKLRASEASYRTRAKEAEAKASQYEQERMTEAERLQEQAKAAQAAAEAASAELRKARAEAAIAREAAKVGVAPDLLLRLVDVEYDDDGQPSNLEAAVSAVLRAYPQLRPAAAPSVAPTNPGRERKLTLDDIKHMKPEEINRRWDEVQAALSGN